MLKMGSFRSYVGLEEYEMKIPHPVTSTFLQPHFLPGELVVAEAHNVLKFTSVTKKKGLSGSLFVTNARLVFVSSSTTSELSPASSLSSCSEDSIPLLSIHTLCYYEGSTNHSSGKKSKKKIYLGPHSNLMISSSLLSSSTTNNSSPSSSQSNSNSPLNTGSGTLATSTNSHLFCSASTRIHELYVISSNFRTLQFSFKFSRVDHGQKICNALIHWSFPQQIEKLFYLDYCRDLDKASDNTSDSAVSSFNSYYNTGSTTFSSGIVASWIPSYNVPGDWLRELKITRAPGFRLTDANINFELCQSLSEHLVAPATMTDVRLISLAGKLRGNRPPFWVWGDANGAAIIRMGKLYNEADSSAENAFYETLRKGNPGRKRPKIYDLDNLVTIKDLRQSLTKLSELCCPESFSQYEETDAKFYSLLENTKWMLWISKIIHLSREIADLLISQGETIILQENESRDTSCLFSSVVQVIVDPRFRTMTGFCSLVQKEWIVTGHQFHSVYMHTSPVFLIFLDTVHQLLLQNVFEFEFNEEFLSDMWDCTFDSTTGTFMFDSPFQRRDLELRKDLTAWYRILTKEDMNGIGDTPQLSSASIPIIPKSLHNPMYKLKDLLYPPSVDKFTFSPTTVSPPLIESLSSMSHLELWSSLFLNRSIENHSSLTSSLIISSPLILPFAKNYSSSPTSSTPTPTSLGSMDPCRSPTQASMFLFSSAINNNNEIIGGDSTSSNIRGRDLMKEMKLVDILINKLSTSTRYLSRNSHVRPNAVPTVPLAAIHRQQEIAASSSSVRSGNIFLRSNPEQLSSTSQSSGLQKLQYTSAAGFARPGIDRPLPRITATRPPPSSSYESGSFQRRKNPFVSKTQEY